MRIVFSMSASDLPHAHEGRLGRKALISTDNRDAASSLAVFVAGWGCAVSIAEDGVTALDQTTRDVPDVVLLDKH